MKKPTLLERRYPPHLKLHANLLNQLATKNRNTFWLGCKTLELLAGHNSLDRKLVKAVAGNLRHPDPWRRMLAAGLCEKFPDPRLLAPLHAALGREKFVEDGPGGELTATDGILEALAAIGSRARSRISGATSITRTLLFVTRRSPS